MPKARDFNRYNIRDGISRNEEKPCTISRCTRPRTKLAAICSTHLHRRKRWGNAEHGRAFSQRDLAPWVEVAQEFVAANRNHKAIRAAVEWFAKRLRDAHLTANQRGPSGTLAIQLRWLEDNGTSPEECLTLTIAVWLYARSLPLEHAPDEVVKRNTAAAILRAAPKHPSERITSKVRWLFGHEVHQALAVLLVHIERHREAEAELEADLKSRDSYAEPFAGSAS